MGRRELHVRANCRETESAMVRASARARPAHRRGLAAPELALALPLIMFLFLLTVDFSRIYYYTVIVSNCAGNGAIYGGANPAAANDTNGIKTAAGRDATNLVAANLNVNSATDSSTAPTYVDVTVTYPFTTFANYPWIPRNYTITRKVRAYVSPWTPS